jgi:ABC-2 type transport system permease protein
MIFTLLRIGWINLKRDRVVQALTFVLPIMFFSIFALVFGQQRNPTRKLHVAVVDEDQSAYSSKLVAALRSEGALAVQTTAQSEGRGPGPERAAAAGLPAGTSSQADPAAPPLDRAGAEALVKDGTLPVAIVLPKGLGEGRRFFGGGDTKTPTVLLLADVSDPVAPQMVQGLLQKVAFTAAPETLADDGIKMFQRYGGPLTPLQQQSVEEWMKELSSASSSTSTGRGAGLVGLPIEVVNVMQPGTGDTATVSFYAAGIGVMFLLFSCSGAGGTLLDEEDSGTLGRLIGSRLGMSGVLFGKWLFLTLTGMTQLCVMFLWGMLAFHLPMQGHVPGFLIMTVATAAAAAGFGLLLATLSRSRQQLSGMSTIIILAMSAVGGSMFPRFLMSETMQKFGLVTFNAWALDGYLKVFWREAPLIELWPQLAVLVTLTVIFLIVARLLARRWERG